MSVTTFDGVIENGPIRLPAGVVLHEQKIVDVVVPGSDALLQRAQAGCRLANPADAAKFEMKVSWGEES
jgi:hypothetical protein